MSGHNERGSKGLDKSDIMYKALMNYTNQIAECGMNMLFDRTFITEQVFCDLGYKDYNFLPVFSAMIRELDSCGFDVHILNLKLNNVELYRERLTRNKAQFHNVKFNITNSVMQQRMYGDVMEDIRRRSSRISIHTIPTDVESVLHDGLSFILKFPIK